MTARAAPGQRTQQRLWVRFSKYDNNNKMFDFITRRNYPIPQGLATERRADGDNTFGFNSRSLRSTQNFPFLQAP
jgi:hypothetical protein